MVVSNQGGNYPRRVMYRFFIEGRGGGGGGGIWHC